MNIQKAIDRFTTDTFSDPSGIGGSLKGRLSVYDDEKSSGESTRRRLLETLPTYAMFSSNCVSLSGQAYIVGSPNLDFHRGVAIRIKYPVIPCEAYKVSSILQILTSTVPSSSVYVALDQTKNSVADSETSSAVTIMKAFFQSLESVAKGQVISKGGSYYRVKSDAYIDGAGFKNAEVILLSSPVRAVTYTQISGYDVVTDSIVNGASFVNTTVFVEDAYYCYDHTSERHSQVKPGDKNITFKPSVTPKAGDTIGEYKILSIDILPNTSFSCHCRK